MPSKNDSTLEEVFIPISKINDTTVSIEDVFEVGTDVAANKTEKDYDLKRNGKKLLKTDIKYVYRLKDTNGYVYRLYHKETKKDTFVMVNPDTNRPFVSKGEASQHMALELDKLNRDRTERNKKLTFGQVWEIYLETPHEKANETIRRYNSIFEHHVKKEFGNKLIRDILVADYNSYFIKMHRTGDGYGKNCNGYSYAYVQSILKFIYLVMSFAFSHRYISAEIYTDFTENVKMPGKKKESDKKEIRVLTHRQIEQIKDMLEKTDFYLPFLISILGGLRPAETFALCFEDVDFTNCTITVNKQMVEETTGKRILKQPKTEASTRTIEVPLIVIQEIQKRKRAIEDAKKADPVLFEQNKEKFIDGREFREDIIEQPNFINVDTKGRYIPAHSFSYWTKQIKKDICPNLPGIEDFSFYTFRKTHLSNMASNNCPIGELMKRAGHSKIETLYTSYYQRTETSEEKLKKAMYEFAGQVVKN